MIRILSALAAFFLWAFSFTAQADLLERFHIEQALQERLQGIVKIYDSASKVLVHVDYHNYEGALPGTNMGDTEKVSPDHIESVDIAKVYVEVYTTLDDVPEEAKTALRNALPVKDKKLVDIKIHRFDDHHINAATKPVEVKDLADIIHSTVDNIAKMFGLFFGGCLVLFFIFSFMQNTRRVREMKEQIKLLATAISESGGGRSMPLPQRATVAASEAAAPKAGVGVQPFENWPRKALCALITDAYWCERDGYANWLWRELSSAQKYELLSELPFLKDYSAFFVDGPVGPSNFHEHPYYLDPQELKGVSQKDLAIALKKEIGLWHFISPMRRQYLPLSIEEKMLALQAPVPKSAKMPTGKSVLRELQTRPTWGDLSASDEMILYEKPDMVPVNMRRHIRSLVWLAKKNSENVRHILAKYDARSLASAWVGPEDVLKVLESGLPEKKLKLLQTYKSKLEPSRDSDVYQMLVDEGLSEDAA